MVGEDRSVRVFREQRSTTRQIGNSPNETTDVLIHLQQEWQIVHVPHSVERPVIVPEQSVPRFSYWSLFPVEMLVHFLFILTTVASDVVEIAPSRVFVHIRE